MEKPIDEMTFEESLAQAAFHEEHLGRPDSTRIALGFCVLLFILFSFGTNGFLEEPRALLVALFAAIFIMAKFWKPRHRIRVTQRGIDLYEKNEWLEHYGFPSMESAEASYAVPQRHDNMPTLAFVRGRRMPLTVIWTSTHGYGSGVLIRTTKDKKRLFIPTRRPAELLGMIQHSLSIIEIQ